jgi:hypothetical protein
MLTEGTPAGMEYHTIQILTFLGGIQLQTEVEGHQVFTVMQASVSYTY